MSAIEQDHVIAGPFALPVKACRSCNANVIWVIGEKADRKTGQFTRMPLDAEPVPNGNVVVVSGPDPILGEGFPEIPIARYLNRVEQAQLRPIGASEVGPRFVSHFGTCPQAKNWRKR